MKKILLLWALLGLSVAAYAQKSGRDVLDALENKVLDAKEKPLRKEYKPVEFRPISHIGWGFYLYDSADFTPAKGRSYEFFINILTVGFYPVDWLGLEIGADFGTRNFGSAEQYFLQDADGHVMLADFSTMGLDFKKKNASLFNTRFTFPILLKGRVGYLEASAGVELATNLGASTSYAYTVGRTSTSVSTRGAQMPVFGYSIMATLSFARIGIFAKWYPGSARVLPEGDPSFHYWTLGFSFGL